MTLFLALALIAARPDSTLCVTDAIHYLSGASDLEAIPVEDAERFENLSRHPLKINSCTRSGMVASGLFSSYQVETLLDYRKNCGPICSVDELAVVDGFDERLAAYMSFFLDFGSSSEGKSHFEGEVSAFAAVRIASGKAASQWMGRAKVSYGAIGASFAGKSQWTWPVSLPQTFGCSVSYSPDAPWLSSAVAGYFNARFGQGLCLWSGSVIENYATPSALMRRPYGITPYLSSSTQYAMRGAAANFVFGPASLSVLYDCSSHRAGADVTWNHRHGQIGVTAWAAVLPQMWNAGGTFSEQWCASVNFLQTLGRLTLYGESTLLENILGGRAFIGSVDVGLRAFWSTARHSAALSTSWLSTNRVHRLDFGSTLEGYPRGKGTIPAGAVQFKALSTYTCTFTAEWSSLTRLSARIRNWTDPYRFDLRQDVRWERGKWKASVRINPLYCRSFAGLGFLEGAFRCRPGESGAVNGMEIWLQTGIFFIDNWEDRIYVYQKDAPQSFNVPAMYGRGWWLSVFSSVRLWKRLELYVRGTWEDYPWARSTDTRTRPSLSVKFQLVVSL